ncbi:hypothetical protein L3V42_09330 [Oceanobacillus sp. APA_J-5(13-2)]|nr:hypothetical protein [Oceanobacillus alkalisoli]MCG5103787.1 hypothetical protein [Oceanobacillus alkalisoli]
MSVDHYRNLCMRYHRRPVEIRTRDRRVHRSMIERVESNRVYLRPLRGSGGFVGFGYGWVVFGFGIALGVIVSLALLPLYFAKQKYTRLQLQLHNVAI